MGEIYIRFIVPKVIDPDSGVPSGVVAVAYDLVDEDKLAPDLLAQLRQSIAWIEKNLATPDRFNRTTSKGWYRRTTRGISWLRMSASLHVAALRRLAELVAAAGYPTKELTAARVGYIVYEDEAQVVAEPFRDTPTR